MRLEIGLDYDVPPTRVKRVLIDAALQAQDVLQSPGPVVYLKDFAASSITYQLKFWIDDHAKQNQIYSDIRTNMWYALRRHNISIPFPTQVEYGLEPPPRKVASREEMREALTKVSFAECLTEHHLGHLVDAARNVQFGKGEHITEQGQEGDSMIILMDGSAEVFISAHGTRTSVAKLKAGDCIGEMSLLTGERRSATVIALTDCDAVEIEKKDVAPIIEETPTLLDSLSNLLATRKLQLDGVVAESGGRVQEEKRKEYRAGFLRSLKSFFEV
jgi:CRP-like cAMP-binding protein